MTYLFDGIRSIKEARNLKGKIVLLRLDVNISIQNGLIENDFRLKKSLPTIEYLKKEGAKIIIIGHIESEGVASLIEIFNYFKKHFPLTFITDPIESLKRETFEALHEGDVVLLDNLRKNPGEKANDQNFIDKLSSLADMYVNEAFSVSHRKHASIVGISRKLPSYCGFVFEDEIRHLSKVFSPKRPFLFILGGAKFDTKFPLVKKFLNLADHIYIGGALANDCFKALGYEIGQSIVSDLNFDLKDILKNKKIVLPRDVVVKNNNVTVVKFPHALEKGDAMWDAGPESLIDLKKLVKESNFVLWNGPLGFYEGGFKESSLIMAKEISQSDAISIIGGGDTLSAINELHIEEKFSFVSTGGGAMLDFLANETLPGIEALSSKF